MNGLSGNNVSISTDLGSGLSAQLKERQISSTLPYTPGEDAEDVLSSTNISSDGRKEIYNCHAEVRRAFSH